MFKTLKGLPKCDLHIHLNGAMPTETVKKLIDKYNIELSSNFNINTDLQILKSVNSLQQYFKPWNAFKKLPIGYECLDIMVRDSLGAMKEHNVKLIELRNSPFNISRINNISLNESVRWLTEAIMKYSSYFDIKTGLILSLTRHENTYECGLKLLQAIKYNESNNVIVGIDLSGDEDFYLDKSLSEIYKHAKFDYGLGISIHAGETGSLDSLKWAIRDCKADRIGHGLAAIKSEQLMEEIIDKDICIEVCLTSNLRSGAVKDIAKHPVVEFYNRGIPFVLCTDNPFVHGSSITDEYLKLYNLINDIELFNNMEIVQKKYSFIGGGA